MSNTPINEMIDDIRARSNKVSFKPSWQQEHENPEVCQPGPMSVTSVRTRGGPLPITFILTSTHLVVHLLEEGRECKLALRCLGSIELVGGELRLHLHLPIPVLTKAGIRPIHVLYGDVDESATARWTWLSSKNNRTSAECPYCFKTALDIEPRPEAPQPMREGKPIAVASCRGCERRFNYDYDQGSFEETADVGLVADET